LEREPYSIGAIYLACRNVVLANSFFELAFYDFATENNCEIIAKSATVTTFLGILLSSILIGIRVIAIWNRDIKVVIPVVTTLVIEIGFLTFATYKVDGAWYPMEGICGYVNIQTALPTTIATVLCDAFLVLVMLSGLLRSRGAHRFRIWRILWNQGVLWLIIVTIAEIPTIFMVHANFNQILSISTVLPERTYFV